MYVLLWIVVGVVAGLLTGRILRGEEHGRLMDLVTGVAGAIWGGFLVLYTGLSGRFEIFLTTLGAILGAVVLAAAIAFVNGRKDYV